MTINSIYERRLYIVNEGVIFIAGAYGVGKSTLCNKLNNLLNIPAFSSGDLISKKNGEKYGTNKVVKDKDYSQQLLIDAVNKIIINSPKLILAGHFCIFNSTNGVEILPEFVYREIHLSKIILLEANADIIIDNLQHRDNKKYSLKEIKILSDTENLQAKKIAKELNIPLVPHKMKFDESDVNKIISVI